MKSQHNNVLHAFSVQCLKKNVFQKLAGLWLVGEVVNHVGLYRSKVAEGCSAFQRRSCFCFAGTFSTESPLICMYEQNVYTLEPGKVQVRTFQVRKLTFCMPFLVTIKPLLSFVDRNSDLYSTSATPMMCTISYYVTPRYYSTRLYFNKILFEILIFICKMWSVLSRLKCIKYKD